MLRKSIEKSAEEDMEFYKKMESKSWKRKKFLAQEYSKRHKNLSNKYAFYLLRTDNYCSIDFVREYSSKFRKL